MKTKCGGEIIRNRAKRENFPARRGRRRKSAPFSIENEAGSENRNDFEPLDGLETRDAGSGVF